MYGLVVRALRLSYDKGLRHVISAAWSYAGSIPASPETLGFSLLGRLRSSMQLRLVATGALPALRCVLVK